jgi:filamin
LEIAISRDGKNIPNYVQNEGGARFRIKFIPDEPSTHHVQVKFNGIEIPGN